MLWNLVRVVIAVVAFLAIWRGGRAVLGSFARPVPAPLPPGEMRKVNLRYECGVCGAQVRMTSAPDELPEPPRHCLEDMNLVAPPLE